jgi:hypothetical protein
LGLGVRSDKWHFPYPLTFVDIDYKSKDPEKSFQAHLKRVAKEKPKLATVPDLSDKEVNEMDIEPGQLTRPEPIKELL